MNRNYIEIGGIIYKACPKDVRIYDEHGRLEGIRHHSCAECDLLARRKETGVNYCQMVKCIPNEREDGRWVYWKGGAR